jgi:hypothetical protein
MGTAKIFHTANSVEKRTQTHGKLTGITFPDIQDVPVKTGQLVRRNQERI